MPNNDVNQLLAKFASKEANFLDHQFVAAKRTGECRVGVRIAGVICRLRVHPRGFEGVGIFQPSSHTDAQLVREATLAERSRYHHLLPRLTLIIVGRHGVNWYGRPANQSGQRVRVHGNVPIQLALDVQTFDTVHARFDGQSCWFEEVDMSTSPVLAARLRDELEAGRSSRDLRIAGLTPELRAAYEELFQQRYAPKPVANANATARRPLEHPIDEVRDRIETSLSHAGAELIDYSEHRDGYRVTYSVDGQRHISSLDKSALTVQSAGFCLSGLDDQFDLASLIGVVREGAAGQTLYFD